MSFVQLLYLVSSSSLVQSKSFPCNNTIHSKKI